MPKHTRATTTTTTASTFVTNSFMPVILTVHILALNSSGFSMKNAAICDFATHFYKEIVVSKI